MKPELFQKVKCNGYLKKVSDGRFIETCKSEGETLDCTYVDTNNPDLDIECEYCGDLDFQKTYFKHKPKRFTGVVVGFKDIVIDGYLTVETVYNWNDCEYTKLGKQPKTTETCAIVYYANNRKRYVPINNIEQEES